MSTDGGRSPARNLELRGKARQSIKIRECKKQAATAVSVGLRTTRSGFSGWHCTKLMP